MKVASFLVNHNTLERGVYISRKDDIGSEVITTFDIRMKLPNKEPVLGTPEIHTLEHLFAVFLRGESGGWEDKVLYVGPMGCRTGMYLLLKGDYSPPDIIPLLTDMFGFVVNFCGAVPASSAAECGNYLEHNLEFAKYEAKKFLNEVLLVIDAEHMEYKR